MYSFKLPPELQEQYDKAVEESKKKKPWEKRRLPAIEQMIQRAKERDASNSHS